MKTDKEKNQIISELKEKHSKHLKFFNLYEENKS